MVDVKAINNYFLKLKVPKTKPSKPEDMVRVEIAEDLKKRYPRLKPRPLYVLSEIITNRMFLGVKYTGKIADYINAIYDDL